MRENGNHGDAELERRTERGVTECEEEVLEGSLVLVNLQVLRGKLEVT